MCSAKAQGAACYYTHMKRRIFVAIDLPTDLKTEIGESVRQWQWLPIRWLRQESWHITIIPPVYLEDAHVALLSSVLEKHRLGGSFTLQFSKIILAPPRSPARMIWLEGATPAGLGVLQKHVIAAWTSEPQIPAPSERALKSHITLARFKPGELAELEQKTRTLGEVTMQFDVSDVALMESRLMPNGAEYETLRTFAV